MTTTTSGIRALKPSEILRELALLFGASAHDRHVYCVYAPYAKLQPFAKRLRQETEKGSLNTVGKVEFLSLNCDIVAYLKAKGTYNDVSALADKGRDRFKSVLSAAFRDLITSRIEAPGVVGLVLSDFELLYAYDLGGNDISIARQVAINGKRVCLLVPGAMRDGRLWIFDDDPESRREFPEALVFKNSGWVFALND